MFCVVERDLVRYQAQVDREAELEAFVESAVSRLVEGDPVEVGDEWSGTTIDQQDVFDEVDIDVLHQMATHLLSGDYLTAKSLIDDAFAKTASDLVYQAVGR